MCLKEMELVGSGIGQIRATASAVVALLLTVDAILLSASIERGVSGGQLTAGVTSLIFVIALSFWVLVPRNVITWPKGGELLGSEAGSLVDDLRVLVANYQSPLAKAHAALEALYRGTVVLIVLAAASVAVWAYILSSLPIQSTST